MLTILIIIFKTVNPRNLWKYFKVFWTSVCFMQTIHKPLIFSKIKLKYNFPSLSWTAYLDYFNPWIAYLSLT